MLDDPAEQQELTRWGRLIAVLTSQTQAAPLWMSKPRKLCARATSLRGHGSGPRIRRLAAREAILEEPEGSAGLLGCNGGIFPGVDETQTRIL